MQKDFHYYMTYALALKAGIENSTAKTIAWSNQFTDELTDCGLGGIQTQCAITGNYKDRQIQQTVLCAFHFIPGDQPSIHPWMVTRDSAKAKVIVSDALKLKCPVTLGMALHTYQDTYSHEGFTGWNEKFNSCFSWDNLLGGLIENVGHADMRTIPDIISAVWTDPRNDNKIVNADKFKIAAQLTFYYLKSFNNEIIEWTESCEFMKDLTPFWQIKSYDERKDWLMKWAGITEKYNDIKEDMRSSNENEFICAARNQISNFMKMVEYL